MIDSELISHNLCTYGFHISDNFLNKSDYDSLRAVAIDMNNKGLFKSAKIGLQVQAQQNATIRNDTICWLDDDSAEQSIQVYLQQTHHLATLLNESLFLSLREFETHFAIYRPGSFYKKHVDQFASTKSRKISCVYYLNENWEEQFGGELKLYNKKDELIQTVTPQGNRFICFNSELPHEVCLTHQTRYSIAGWMKASSSIL